MLFLFGRDYGTNVVVYWRRSRKQHSIGEDKSATERTKKCEKKKRDDVHEIID